jgi:hypothetical protein
MKYLGITLVVLALVAAVVPQFTDCTDLVTLANGNKTPMKCHWTALSEMAVGIPILAVGAMMTLSRRKETYMALSVLGIILGAFVIMLPNNLIGVCSMPTHICVTTLKPAATTVGVLITGISLAGAVISFRKKE